MIFKKRWKYKKTTYDGKGLLFGVNIFNYPWTYTGKTVEVKDPKYKQIHSVDVYAVDINGINRTFAAEEISNYIWVFYTERFL